MNKSGQRLKLGQSQSNLFRNADTVVQERQIDKLDDQQLLKRQYSYEDAMQLSVKDHVDKSEAGLQNLKEDLKQSRNNLNFLRDELIRLREEVLKNHDGVTKYACDEINRIQNDLRKGGQQDQIKMDSFTMQMVQLRIDKEELDQQTQQTELRTQQCEFDVGFKRIYD